MSIVQGSPIFEEAWLVYPDRHVCENKRETLRQWEARLREKVSEEEMLEGAKRYASYCQRNRMVNTQFVMQPRRFFGRDRSFELDWKLAWEKGPDTPAVSNTVKEKLEKQEEERATPEEAKAFLQALAKNLVKSV